MMMVHKEESKWRWQRFCRRPHFLAQAKAVSTLNVASIARRGPRQMHAGFSLLEILVVVAILAALAGLVIPLTSSVQQDSQENITKSSLNHLRNTIMGTSEQPGYWKDLRRLPVNLSDLFLVPLYLPSADQHYDRNTHFGWRGPYLQHQGTTFPAPPDANARNMNAANGITETEGKPALADGWLHPIVIQYPTIGTAEEQASHARLISAGSDGIVQTPANVLYPLPAQRGDDLILFLRRADVP